MNSDGQETVNAHSGKVKLSYPNSYKCLVYGTKEMENDKQDRKDKIIKWGMKWHVSRHYDLGAYDFLKV